MSSETIYSQLQWFSKSKGYGFSLTSSGEQLFCHHSDIRMDTSISSVARL
jgi:cold shock CspA family protein